MTFRDARTLARIVNLAERCGCSYRLLTSERAEDRSHYCVTFETVGSQEALRLLDSQLKRILAYEEEISL